MFYCVFTLNIFTVFNVFNDIFSSKVFESNYKSYEISCCYKYIVLTAKLLKTELLLNTVQYLWHNIVRRNFLEIQEFTGSNKNYYVNNYTGNIDSQYSRK